MTGTVAESREEASAIRRGWLEEEMVLAVERYASALL